MATNITFDSNDIQTDNIITSSIEHNSIPLKDAKLYSLAHANRSTIPYVSYPSRSVRVSGKIIDTTVAGLEARLDTFKAYFRGTDKNLDIDFAGTTRRYIATANGVSIDQPGGLQHADFDIQFICSEPFGRNITSTSAESSTGRTASTYTDTHVFLGTAPYQLPIITIEYTAVTGGNNSLMFSNDATGQAILILGQTFVADDIVVIDCENKSVTLNGVEIDSLGAFPEFEPGSRDFTYTDGFTTRTFNIDVDYYPMWL